jgi:NDP-sugar pyrophosphorylase family protein
MEYRIPHPKTLLRVGGKELLTRTLDLVQENTTVIGERYLASYLRDRDRLITLADPGYCIISGLAATQAIWCSEGRVVVLLGDVLYSPECMRSILSDQRPLAFFGTADLSQGTGELFSMIFTKETVGEIADMVVRARCNDPESNIYQCGHLRTLLWGTMVNRGQYANHNFYDGDGIISNLYTIISDYTMDFDLPEHLERIPEIERLLPG